MEFFDRMLDEFTELDKKTTKLRDFLVNSVDKADIDNLNKDLLVGQLKAMETYLTILSVRIGLNAPKQSDKAEEAKSEVSE